MSSIVLSVIAFVLVALWAAIILLLIKTGHRRYDFDRLGYKFSPRPETCLDLIFDWMLGRDPESRRCQK